MRLSQFPSLTLREDPRDATAISHKLLLRAGLIRQVSSGIFIYMPVFYRTLRKVQEIIRQEMDAAGAVEIKMPHLQPKELWEESGRWERYTKIDGIMFHMVGRRDNALCLAPTAEEVVTDLARHFIHSHKDLPVNFYQIATKFRDEIRPRFGLMRGSEFEMKDAYSFDTSAEKMLLSYEKMREAYGRIFTRCGAEFKMVAADSGAIGGSGSAEFMILAQTGEDLVLSCDSCAYAANVEKAETVLDTQKNGTEMLPMEIIDTPEAKTMEDLEKHGLAKHFGMKTVLYIAGSEPIAVFIRGDLDINEVKLGNILPPNTLFRPMTEAEVEKYTGVARGSVGPHELNSSIKIYYDLSTRDLINFIAGANVQNKHKINVNWERDLPRLEQYYDLRTVKAGDHCPHCAEGRFIEARGIEVGHIFQLGTKYSDSMHCVFTAEDGTEKPCYMGCYGIGVSRLIQAVIEASHDEKGIIWPAEIAPFRVHLVGLKLDDEATKVAVDEIYAQLSAEGVEVLYDDRTASAGEKFADADLLGVPVRITVSPRTLAEQKVEWKARTAQEAEVISLAEALGRLK